MEKQPINHEDRNVPQPIRSDGAGAIDAGPRNMMRDIQNPNILVPPVTDEGMIPNLRFSFSDAPMKLDHGGWSREITVRQLPISTAIAGVNMSLTAGGVRELHWHKQAEWAYCFWDGPASPQLTKRGEISLLMLVQAIFGTFPQEFRTPFKD